MSFDRKPQLDGQMVNEFVIAAHRDLARVKEMLAEEPQLINSCWNWGGDDWETAIGGAAHTGQKEIAEYLLTNGAHLDIFCAAMLGKKKIVAAFIEDDPAVVHKKGPHGIPLIVHAKAGGQDEIVSLIEAHS